MPKRLHDDVIVFQTSDSLMVNEEDSLKSSESKESLRRSDSEDYTRGRGTESWSDVKLQLARVWCFSDSQCMSTATAAAADDDDDDDDTKMMMVVMAVYKAQDERNANTTNAR